MSQATFVTKYFDFFFSVYPNFTEKLEQPVFHYCRVSDRSCVVHLNIYNSTKIGTGREREKRRAREREREKERRAQGLFRTTRGDRKCDAVSSHIGYVKQCPSAPCEGIMPKWRGHLISVRKNPIEPAHPTFRIKLLPREIALAHFVFDSRRESSNSVISIDLSGCG